MRIRRKHPGKPSYRKTLRAGMIAISVFCPHFAHAIVYQDGGPTGDPFQTGNPPTHFTAKVPGDLVYESPSAKAAPDVTAPPLDLFGSASDLKNAATAIGNTPADAASLSNGVLTVRLTQNGLNVVNMHVPDGTAISGIDVVTGAGAVPAGLVLNIAGSHIVFSGDTFDLGPLNTRQVLLSFGGQAVLLSALSFKLLAFASLAATRFDKGGVNSALVPTSKAGINDAAFGAPLPVYGASGGGTTAADRGR